MPDSRASYEAPRGWSDAFAALPLETPPPGGWEALSRRLPAARRTRRPYWIAIAAALALAAVIPASRWGNQETPSAPSPLAAAPSLPVAAAPGPTPAATAAATDRPHPAVPASAVEAFPAPAAPPRIAHASRASAASPAKPRDSGSTARAQAAMDASHASLETLYAESARLEAVLAQLQEPRVASAAAAALSADLQDRIADIDSALSEPGMPSASQLDLWQQRVDALRQLTGMETTQRWMAAQGAATEGPWTQVY